MTEDRDYTAELLRCHANLHQPKKRGKMTFGQKVIRFAAIPAVCLFMLSVCVFFVILGTSDRRMTKKYQNAEKFTATASLAFVTEESRRDAHDMYHKYYKATWKYEVNGETFYFETENGFSPSQNEMTVTLYQDENGRYHVWEPTGAAEGGISIGMLFIIIPIFLILTAFVVAVLWAVSAP